MSPKARRIETHDELHPGDAVLVFADGVYTVGIVVAVDPDQIVFERRDTGARLTANLPEATVFLIEGGLPG